MSDQLVNMHPAVSNGKYRLKIAYQGCQKEVPV